MPGTFVMIGDGGLASSHQATKLPIYQAAKLPSRHAAQAKHCATQRAAPCTLHALHAACSATDPRLSVGGSGAQSAFLVRLVFAAVDFFTVSLVASFGGSSSSSLSQYTEEGRRGRGRGRASG